MEYRAPITVDCQQILSLYHMRFIDPLNIKDGPFGQLGNYACFTLILFSLLCQKSVDWLNIILKDQTWMPTRVYNMETQMNAAGGLA